MREPAAKHVSGTAPPDGARGLIFEVGAFDRFGRSGFSLQRLQEGAGQDDFGDHEIDDQAGDVDDGGDEGGGAGGRVEAEGEASAIFARLEAEARGQFEILAKKGEGLKQIIAACGSAEKAYQLLMLEHIDKLAETSAQAISNIKFDKVVVWDNGHGSNGNGAAGGSSGTAGFLQNMVRMMPPIMQVMKDIGGVELPSYMGRV